MYQPRRLQLPKPSAAAIYNIKPILRAYALGYLTAVGPRLIGFLRTIRRKDLTVEDKLEILVTILKTSTQINRLPTACAIIAGGATTLPRLIQAITRWLASIFSTQRILWSNTAALGRLRFACTFFASWIAFNLLNRDKQWVRRRAMSRGIITRPDVKKNLSIDFDPPSPAEDPRFAGKTIDLTLFALVHAIDATIVALWRTTRRNSRHPENRAPRLAYVVKTMFDPTVFAASSGIIMWAWFYTPERLPKAYRKWISAAAQIDVRIIEALRRARQGVFLYGRETGQAHLMTSLCRDRGLPEEWGDPVKTVPMPCPMAHDGICYNCELYGCIRFWRSWLFAMKLYVPLQLITRLRSPTPERLLSGLKGAVRSSSFLAVFVATFYYSVCLARTRLGPRLFSKQNITPQMWDSGYCVLAGCLACGWSILLEKESRRKEIAFFVAPRALATLSPRVYDQKHIKREQVIFASSMAIILAATQSPGESPVRGVLGKILRHVLQD